MNHPRRLLRFRSFLQSRQAILDTGRLLAIAMIAGFGGTHLAAGATLLVAPADATISASENPGSISDGANGATPPPLYRSIQSAIDHARPGDIIQVSPGVYHENLQFPHSGRPAEPITLTGAPGAIIDGGTTQKLDWQPAPDIAPGVWRTPLDFPVFTIAANGKLVTTLDEKRTDPDREHRPATTFVGPTPSATASVPLDGTASRHLPSIATKPANSSSAFKVTLIHAPSIWLSRHAHHSSRSKEPATS